MKFTKNYLTVISSNSRSRRGKVGLQHGGDALTEGLE